MGAFLDWHLLRSCGSGSGARGRRWVIQLGQMLMTAQSVSGQTCMKKPPPKQGLPLDLLASSFNGKSGWRQKNCNRTVDTAGVVFHPLLERLLTK